MSEDMYKNKYNVVKYSHHVKAFYDHHYMSEMKKAHEELMLMDEIDWDQELKDLIEEV